MVDLDFKIKRGLSSELFPYPNEPSRPNDRLKIEEGCWYLCIDTADLYLGINDDGNLKLKQINEHNSSEVSIPTKLSELLNDCSFITKADADAAIDNAITTSVPTKISQLENDIGYITELPSFDAYATEAFVQEEIAKIEHPDVSNFITDEDIDAKGFLTEQALTEYAKKTELFSKDYNDLTGLPEIPSIDGLATEDFVINKIAEAELNNKEVDFSGLATKDEIKDLASTSYVDEKVAAIEIPEVNLDGYATEDFVNTAVGRIELPEVPEKLSAFINDTGYLTETDISGKADRTELFSKDYNDLINKPELFSGNYSDLINAPEIPSIEGLATEEYVVNAISNIDIPKTDLSSYYNKEEVDNLIENIEHPGVDTNLDNYYTKDETDTALQLAIAEKADTVPFTASKIITTAIGNFQVGDDVRGLTLTEILAKLLGLTDNENTDIPSISDGVVATIIAEQLPMYSIASDNTMTANSFEILTFDSTTAQNAPEKSGFYQIVENGEVVESGYQDLSIVNDELYYVIALPKIVDYNNTVRIQAYDDDDNIWVDCSKLPLISDPSIVTTLCDEVGIDLSNIDQEIYTVWVLEDICTGSKLRYIIEEVK